jgi:hypothetical protein
MAANAALRINSYSGLFDSVNVQVQSLDNLWSDQVVCDLAGAVQYFRTVEILNPFYGIEDAPLCLPYLFITATPIGGAGAPVIATAASVIGWSV